MFEEYCLHKNLPFLFLLMIAFLSCQIPDLSDLANIFQTKKTIVQGAGYSDESGSVKFFDDLIKTTIPIQTLDAETKKPLSNIKIEYISNGNRIMAIAYDENHKYQTVLYDGPSQKIKKSSIFGVIPAYAQEDHALKIVLQQVPYVKYGVLGFETGNIFGEIKITEWNWEFHEACMTHKQFREVLVTGASLAELILVPILGISTPLMMELTRDTITELWTEYGPDPLRDLDIPEPFLLRIYHVPLLSMKLVPIEFKGSCGINPIMAPGKDGFGLILTQTAEDIKSIPAPTVKSILKINTKTPLTDRNFQKTQSNGPMQLDDGHSFQAENLCNIWSSEINVRFNLSIWHYVARESQHSDYKINYLEHNEVVGCRFGCAEGKGEPHDGTELSYITEMVNTVNGVMNVITATEVTSGLPYYRYYDVDFGNISYTELDLRNVKSNHGQCMNDANDLFVLPKNENHDNESLLTRTPFSYDFQNPNCAKSRLVVGDRGMISLIGGRNAIRSTPDTHSSNNIIGYANPGEFLQIVNGPVCNFNWILWEVRLEKDGLLGWTPETDGKDFWIELVRK